MTAIRSQIFCKSDSLEDGEQLPIPDTLSKLVQSHSIELVSLEYNGGKMCHIEYYIKSKYRISEISEAFVVGAITWFLIQNGFTEVGEE
jgi:hypothetical protein